MSEEELTENQTVECEYELPTSLIITNVAETVFSKQTIKDSFEAAFQQYEENATFQYLKSFYRARVNFTSPEIAARARIELHNTTQCDATIKCYFFMPLETDKDQAGLYLEPPKPERMFFISPPASPPIDWKPAFEGRPIINYELLSAMAKLAPGKAHELHPPSDSQPAIVLHVCDNPEGFNERPQKIEQTRCPERNN